MRQLALLAVAFGLGSVAPGSASAADFVFDADPFEGSTALTTPGRQVVGGEPFISFDTSSDRFVFDPVFFAVGDTLSFANDVVANLAPSGLNVIVLETLDNDSNPGTAFGAGNAANLLAGQITSDGAGFFIYYNSGLDLPRLVYSTNLSDPTADLKILARMTNLTGDPASLSSFTAQNFGVLAPVPEPTTWAMILVGFGLVGGAQRSAKRRQRVMVSYG
jgi:hypothetical protein